MQDPIYARLARDPDFIRLAAERDRLGMGLFAVTMVLFAALLLLVAAAPGLLARPMVAGQVASIGWPAGAALIVLPWLLTLIYVRRANRDRRVMAAVVSKAVAA